jgi:uncharacterized protein (TIGR03437 family)
MAKMLAMTLLALPIFAVADTCTFPGEPGLPYAPVPGVMMSFESLTSGLPTPLVPGALVRINGFVFSYEGHPQLVATSTPLPTTLGGTQVLVNGTVSPLLAIGFDASRMPPVDYLVFQVPNNIAVAETLLVQLRMTPPDGTSCLSYAAPQPSAKFAPALFEVQGAGFFDAQSGRAIAQDQPATANEYLTVYGTGFGITLPAVTAGIPANQAAVLLENISVTIDGTATEVQYAGVAPTMVGVNQINFRVPEGLPPGRHTVGVIEKDTPDNKPREPGAARLPAVGPLDLYTK